MTELIPLTDRQAARPPDRQLRELWVRYGAALRAKAALSGDMTWKRVGGGATCARIKYFSEASKQYPMRLLVLK